MHARKRVGNQRVVDGSAGDGERLEYRYAGGEKRAECARKPRHSGFHHEVADLRQLDGRGVPHPYADLRFEEDFYEEDYADYDETREDIVFLHEVGDVDDGLRERGHPCVAFQHIRKNLLELRNDEYH